MKIIRTIGLLLGAVLVGGISYCSYNFMTAENRVRELCGRIKPTMPVAELKAFSAQHGLRPDVRDTGVSVLVESESFGRHGCRVVVNSGFVQASEYVYSD
jgi:hypothetical protein